jgi:hypothetical protein
MAHRHGISVPGSEVGNGEDGGKTFRIVSTDFIISLSSVIELSDICVQKRLYRF